MRRASSQTFAGSLLLAAAVAMALAGLSASAFLFLAAGGLSLTAAAMNPRRR